MKNHTMMTSESVTEGHPDKLCDQISDAVVDHFLMQDPYAKIRAECAVSSAVVFIAARFSSDATVDFSHVARKVIDQIGYDQKDFNAKTCSILTSVQQASPDKYRLFREHEISEEEIDRIAVKNQVTVFGFACDQTPALMPLPIWLAHKLARRLSTIRRQKSLPYIMPDGKVQVGVEYRDTRPHRIHSVTITASQKKENEPDLQTLHQDIVKHVVEPTFEGETTRPDKETRIFVNPDGPFLGGPSTHSGLTGRKNAIDTYGEYSRHSGKALSGKDPLRIDRVGAYAARHTAKNLVAAGLAASCEVTVSYSIGLTQPVSLAVDTRGTGTIPDDQLTERVRKCFDFRLAGILKRFNLRYLPSMHPEGFYQKLATYGHFGRTDLDLPWERADMIHALLRG
jgi:S-adenosylmethionine synthetase